MAHNGRDLVVAVTGTTLVAIRSKGLSISASPIDVTNDDDAGERILLPDPGVRSAEISVAGVTEDEVLIAEIMGTVTGRTLKNAKVTLPSTLTTPGNVNGDFFVSEFSISGEHDGAVEFEATLMSAGALTYVASV